MTRRALVGIDPAISNSGLVILEGGVWSSSTYKSPSLPRGEQSPTAWSARIERAAARLALSVPPGSVVAIEGPAHGAKHGNPDERAGLRWSLIARLRHRECSIVVIPPTSAKMWLSGSGTANKVVMIAAAKACAPVELLIATEHEADAFALVSMLAAHLGEPVFPLPRRGAEALGKVSWDSLEGNEK